MRPAVFSWFIICSSEPRAVPPRRLLAPLPRAIIGDFARARLVLHDREPVARFRRAGEAEHFDRHRGNRLRNVLSLIVDERPHASPFAAGDHDVAHAQGPALHENGRDRAAAAVEFRLDDRAFRRAVGVGLEIENFGLQPDRFQQLAEIGLLRGRDLDVERLAAHRFDLHFVLQQFGAHAFGLGVGFVDLVDGDDDRNLRRARVLDRFHRLRLDAVIGGDHQHHEVGDLGAARAHRGEGGVARRVDEGDFRARRRRHLIGADVLGDAARFAGDDIGGADRVEKRSLAVIDVTHDGDDRRPRLHMRRVVGRVEQAFDDVGFRDALDRVAQFLGDQLRGVGIDRIVDRRHLALFHQEPDDVDGALGHAVRELLDGDRFPGSPPRAKFFPSARRKADGRRFAACGGGTPRSSAGARRCR